MQLIVPYFISGQIELDKPQMQVTVVSIIFIFRQQTKGGS